MKLKLLTAATLCLCLLPGRLTSQASPNEGTFLLTIFLRHDQTKTVDEINEHSRQTKFAEMFPPKGIEVVSWYVMMGIGQVVTLRVPPSRLREVNLAIERGAWGGYRTEFYATYDFKPIWEANRTAASPAR
jgi:uncharacterized protein with GYD domain